MKVTIDVKSGGGVTLPHHNLGEEQNTGELEWCVTPKSVFARNANRTLGV